jgi:predicted nucleotide-binding protein
VTSGADLQRARGLLAAGRALEAGRLVATLPLWRDSDDPRPVRLQMAIRRAIGDAPDRVGPLVAQLLEEMDESTAGAGDHSVFIVHGWDTELKYAAKNYFQNTLGADPVILHEQGGDGGTLIDKFERHADRCALAVILLSDADEPGDGLASPGAERRPRPNVLFEMGYFFSRLGRGGVILLRRGDVALNSDVLGIEWIDVTNGVEAAGESIRRRVPWLSS